MIYKHSFDTFNLRSEWTCTTKEINGSWQWTFLTGPTADSRTLDFPVTLPADAIISRAWIEIGIGSPLGGSKYFRCNGEKIPSSGIIEIKTVTATTKTVEAKFEFKSNGVVYKDATKTHMSVMMVKTPTLTIEYASESENAPEIDPNGPGNINRAENAGRQLPRLLDASLNEVARIAAKVSLDLQLDPLSTATMEIPWGQPDVHVRDFVELFDPNGSAGIYRVSKVEQKLGRSTKAWLKHAFVTLEDDITIGVPAIEGTFGAVVGTLLACQSVLRWTLGDVELPDEYTVLYSVGSDSVKAAIGSIFEKLPAGYYWDLDTMHYPWVMHLRTLPEDDLCEGRMSRNLSGVDIIHDDRDLCTRVYAYGAGEGEDRINLATLTGALFMDADTQDDWGIVVKKITEDDIFDSITLQDVAKLYLDINKDPLLSVTLDAVNLQLVTGENLDRFYPGRLCRLSLPDYKVIMNERVISISYPDVYGRPGAATVTLANRVRDSFDDLANLVREASASKLIGGTVATEELKNSANGVTPNASLHHTFEINTYGNLLAAKVRYTARPSARCRIRVDGKDIEGAEKMAQPIDILRYLTTDENGIPTVGEHYVAYYPVSGASEKHWMQSTVILKTIEKQ